ncbi:uncharacterized protein SAPINGB_P001601 [Magnusiomyces paraingens]|uniref:Endoplasmic reticulum-Golgi intermediate compartment protein n=1 Tax=Magnusiomyces paraingens TaxID=2606893 RepID=A0A5E8B6S1_9ASCO|nr:uncharacterized protein SAPINGB_P001601 [Saprochaete ingens]VVT47217.1 unnamed protein product [Saprochaete ingens]
MASFHYKWLKRMDFYGKVSPKYMRRKTNYPLWLQMIIIIFLVFVLWGLVLDHLEADELYSFRVDGGDSVETSLQINVDITVATPCSALIVNVLDKSNDRMFASEVLHLDDVQFQAPVEDVNAAGYAGSSFNSADDPLANTPNGKHILGLLEQLAPPAEISAPELESRSQSLLSVLRSAKQSTKYRRSTPLPAQIKHDLAADSPDASPPSEYTDGSVGCRVYGSFPVTKVQGTLHIISKAVFLSGGRISSAERRLLTSQAARDDMWLKHRNRFPPSHYIFTQINFTHYIDELSFGAYYPKVINPLDGTRSHWPVRALRHRVATFFRSTKSTDSDMKSASPALTKKIHNLMSEFRARASAISAYNYFLSIVPTTYKSSRTGKSVATSQYAVTEQVRDLSWDYVFDNGNFGPEFVEDLPNEDERLQLDAFKKAVLETHGDEERIKNNAFSTSSMQPPGIYFQYDLDPLLLEITETRTSFLLFLVRLVNILAGIYVLSIAFVTFVIDRRGGTGSKGVSSASEKEGLLDDKTFLENVAYAPN